MPSTSRLDQLSHEIQRLEKRLERLRQAERRFVWYRLTAFQAGALLTWGAATFVGGIIIMAIYIFHRREIYNSNYRSESNGCEIVD